MGSKHRRMDIPSSWCWRAHQRQILTPLLPVKIIHVPKHPGELWKLKQFISCCYYLIVCLLVGRGRSLLLLIMVDIIIVFHLLHPGLYPTQAYHYTGRCRPRELKFPHLCHTTLTREHNTTNSLTLGRSVTERNINSLFRAGEQTVEPVLQWWQYLRTSEQLFGRRTSTHKAVWLPAATSDYGLVFRDQRLVICEPHKRTRTHHRPTHTYHLCPINDRRFWSPALIGWTHRAHEPKHAPQ